jgi:MscS family membrane protein
LRRFLLQLATAWFGCVAALLSGLPLPAHADAVHPLEPVDLSSPRATLYSFLDNVNAVLATLKGEALELPPYQLFLHRSALVKRALDTLDLSQTPPSTRIEVGYDAGTYLYEVLTRIELPPRESIPGTAEIDGAKTADHWTIPHTEITLTRVNEGARQGAFLFSADTVARAEEFYLKTRHLPYRTAVPVEHFARMRESLPGWMIPVAAVKQLPAWMKGVAFGQAVWKWCAAALLLLIVAGLIAAVRSLVRRYRSDRVPFYYLWQLVTPLTIIGLLLTTAYLLTDQINFVGSVARGVSLLTGAAVYLLAIWAAWLASLLVAELVILSPRIGEESLDAQLLRLTARIVGIVLGIVLVFHAANQVGIPLVGVLAGVSVGGLAIALAAQDSLKNLLGSLMIFMDQPYKPGERIVVQGHDGFVEQIGLRSTKIRMLDGALTSIPNEKMANLDIENIGRRKFIRRQANIRLAYETPPHKVERALEIVREILEDHEGMQPELPPRVFFDVFNPDSLNIQVSYWYHPPKRWESLAYDERVNLEILRRFEAEDIRLAPPSSTTRLTQDAQQALRVESGPSS